MRVFDWRAIKSFVVGSAVARAVVVGGALAFSACHHPADPPEAPPPSSAVLAVGDGEMVMTNLGPNGGTVKLSQDGPSVVIPSGAADKPQVSLSMAKEAPFAPPTGHSLGTAFRVTLELEAASRRWFSVESATLGTLPAGCTDDNLELGVERPSTGGPPDGQGVPANEWVYSAAKRDASHAVAEVPKFWPQRMQFVCGRRH